MKRFMRGAAVVVAIWIVLIVINVICNINGHELDPVLTGTAAAVGAVLVEGGLAKNEKKKDDQKSIVIRKERQSNASFSLLSYFGVSGVIKYKRLLNQNKYKRATA